MKPRHPARAGMAQAAARIARVLGDEGLLIGGLAVAAHGHVRATDDVDFISRLEPRLVLERLAKEGIRARLRRGDQLEGDPPWVIQGKLGGVRFDILPPLVAVDWDHPLRTSLPGGTPIRVVDLEALIRLKLRAGGPQDLWDVAELLKRHPALEGETLRAAEAFGSRGKVEIWLRDPRVGRGRR